MRFTYHFFNQIIIFVILAILGNYVKADSYCPSIGEHIKFYPVSNQYKNDIEGYDCFYNPALAYKNGKSKNKPSYRFNVNEVGLTPFNEIEGHTFMVKSTMKENPTKEIDKQNFLCFLTRDDGEEILLRIPFVRKETDNILTKSMSLLFVKQNVLGEKSYTYQISIPACPVNKIDSINNSFKGKWVIRNKNLPVGEIETRKSIESIFKTSTNYINSSSSEEFHHSINNELLCDSISFMDVQSYIFQQPIFKCLYKGEKINIPVFDFRGVGDSQYGALFDMSMLFTDKQKFIEDEIDALKGNKEVIEKFIGKELRFINYDNYSSTRNVALTAWNANSNKAFNLYNDQVFHCKGIDVCNFEDKYGSKISLVFISKINTEFQIGINNILANIQRGSKSLVLEEEYQAELTAREEEEIKQKQHEVEKEKDRLKYLTRLYGASNAKKIMDGVVRLGFSKKMCEESWGKPDHVNTTITKWGKHEQWVYRSGEYLYFEGDKLVTIQE